MKYCKNCGNELPDTAHFCGQCGKVIELSDENNMDNSELEKRKRNIKFNKKWLLFGGIAIVLITILVVVLFGFKDKKRVKEYEQYMTMAEKYLEELDYEQAIDTYLKAIEIQPKEREAYIRVAEIYLEQEEYDKVEEILDKADSAGAEQTQEQEKKEEQIKEQIKEQPEKELYSWVVEPTIEADDIFYLADYPGDVSLNELYKQAEDSRAVIQRAEQYGIIDMNGKILADVEYKKMASFGDHYMMVRTTPKYEQEYERDWDLYWLTDEGDIQAGVGNGDLSLWYYYYYEGKRQFAGYVSRRYVKEAIPVRNSKVYTTSKVETKEIWDNLSGKYAIDNNGTLVTDFIFDECGSVSDGLLTVSQNGKWGYVDEKGKTVIPIEYDASWEQYPVFNNGSSRSTDNTKEFCYAASDGYVVLRKNDEWELRDTEGKTVIKQGIFEAIRPVFNGKCWVKKDGKWGVIKLANSKSENLDEGLTEQEIFEKMKEALAITQMCRGVPTAKYLDTEDVLYSSYSMVTEWPYYCVTYPEVSSYQDLMELLQQYYTTDVSDNLEREYYIERDGKLYLPSGSGYGGAGTEKRRIQITKHDENTYHIVEIYVYNDSIGIEDYYEEFNYVYEDSKWVFDEEIWTIEPIDIFVLEERRVIDKNDEETLHSIFQKEVNNAEIAFYYDDFDGDGTNEAYGVTGEKGTSEDYIKLAQVYYINSKGEIWRVAQNVKLYGYCNGLMDTGTSKFLKWNASAGGSGGITYLFGVKDGKAYQPTVSGQFFWFNKLEDQNTYEAVASEFSGGYHNYSYSYYVFDSKTKEFIKSE